MPIYNAPNEREKTIENNIRKALHAQGWFTVKLSGSMYVHGLPDLYCFQRSTNTTLWIESKAPGKKLRPTQVKRFPKWDHEGIRIYVLTSDTQLDRLSGPPNWRDYLPPSAHKKIEL